MPNLSHLASRTDAPTLRRGLAYIDGTPTGAATDAIVSSDHRPLVDAAIRAAAVALSDHAYSGHADVLAASR